MNSGLRRISVTIVIILTLLRISLVPAVSLATETLTFQFVSNMGSTLTTGIPNTVFFNLLDSASTGITGNVKAAVTSPDGRMVEYPVNGTHNPYSITDLTLDTIGNHALMLTDASGSLVTTTLYVIDPWVRVLTTGSLILNEPSQVLGKLIDSYGNDLGKKSITIDGIAVGATPSVQTLTTLNDGTFTLAMTPTLEGLVKIIYSGDLVGTIRVEASNALTQRIGSMTEDNAALSVAVSQSGWSKAENVILTRDDALSDALTAVPLSKKLDAPILMTPSSRLDLNVSNEIKALGAQTVYIIGGTAAISTQIETDLINQGLQVERLGGIDRYETAVRIAQKFNPVDTVYLAYGYGEPDALAASAFAAQRGIPILLTETNTLPEVTQSQLTTLAPSHVVLLGGTAVIGSTIEDQLRPIYTVERWGGSDRFDTEQIIFQHLFTPNSPVYFTSSLVTPRDVNGGRPFGDALVAAALAAKNNGFVVILPTSDKSTFSLSSPPYNFLLMNKDDISQSTVVGNYKAVSNLAEEELQRLLND